MTTTTTETAESIAAELAEVREKERETDRAYKDTKRELRQTASRLERALNRARSREDRGETRTLSARTQAGPKNIERMLTAFKGLGGRASAAAATAAAGSKPGHQVWAIRALAEEGFIEDTGEKDGRSVVYTLTDKGKREARKITRRPPGS